MINTYNLDILGILETNVRHENSKDIAGKSINQWRYIVNCLHQEVSRV